MIKKIRFEFVRIAETPRKLDLALFTVADRMENRFPDGNFEVFNKEELKVLAENKDAIFLPPFNKKTIARSSRLAGENNSQRKLLGELWSIQANSEIEKVNNGERDCAKIELFKNGALCIYIEYRKNNSINIVCENYGNDSTEKRFEKSYLKELWNYLNEEFDKCRVKICFVFDDAYVIDKYDVRETVLVTETDVELSVNNKKEFTELQWKNQISDVPAKIDCYILND